jgi:hypothetical protein
LLSDGLKPTIKMILLEQSRFIIFDALSYLGAVSRGWHDSLSGTYVVKKKRSLTKSIRFLMAIRRIWKKQNNRKPSAYKGLGFFLWY